MEWGNKLNTKKKILVVDDKGMNRYMLGGIFRDKKLAAVWKRLRLLTRSMINWR